jgi:hypothetical protein
LVRFRNAAANYFFNIGPSDQDLLGHAKHDMLEKTPLIGSSSAVINVTRDVKHTGFIIWRRKKTYVSAEVIEIKK